MRRLILVVALCSLTGCGTIRSLAGPDPALVAVAPTINRALDGDSTTHPANKPQNDQAKAVLGNVVNPPAPDDGWLSGLGVLLAAFGVPGASLITAGVAYLKGRKTEAAVDQHADLIDSVTPEEAEFAARPKKRKAKGNPA